MRKILLGLGFSLVAFAVSAQIVPSPPGSGGGGGGVTAVACPNGTITTSGTCNPIASGGVSGDVVTASGTTTVQDSGTLLSALAPLAGPAFTGNPTAPTQAGSDNSTRLATTAYVQGAVAGGGATIHGTPTAGHCASWFSASAVQDAGSACGSGGAAYASLDTPITSTLTGPASTSVVTMAGMAASANGCSPCTITPSATGKVLITITAFSYNNGDSVAADGINAQMYYGTGTPPSNGAAVTGTAVGASMSASNPVSLTATYRSQLSSTVLLTGLTTSTAYWFDYGQEAVGHTGFQISRVHITAAELP